MKMLFFVICLTYLLFAKIKKKKKKKKGGGMNLNWFMWFEVFGK
jgi:hypothetical protein